MVTLSLIGAIFLAVTLGVMDRVRGDTFGFSKTFDLIIYGALVSTLVGMGSYWFALSTALFAVGGTFGWGGPMGEYLYGSRREGDIEWWEIKGLPVIANLYIRGSLWGFAHQVIGLILYQTQFKAEGFQFMLIGFAIPVAYIFSMILGKYLPIEKVLDSKWEGVEYLRGWLLGFIIVFVLYFKDFLVRLV